MRQNVTTTDVLAGVQWFLFMFANIVVIPIGVGAAYQLQQDEIVSLLQLSFIVTGLACLAQVLFGHGRPIMEGQSGLWWGIFLTLVVTTSAQDMPLHVLGGSLALGVILSGLLTVIIGLTGLGAVFGKLFKPGVMGVFMMLLGLTLMSIFFKGMFGIPFGLAADDVVLQIPTGLLALAIVVFVIIFSIKAPVKWRSYALLIGIVVGWICYVLIFGSAKAHESTNATIKLFPLGALTWDTGVVLTALLAGLLNISNTYGALLGTDELLGHKTSANTYRKTFTVTGIVNTVSGFFGLVPYAPYVSSIGFLQQTAIYRKSPFIIGSILFVFIGIIKPIGAFFSLLPLSIGSAVLFVAYAQFFQSALQFFKSLRLNAVNMYRVAIPFFVGAIIMMLPSSYFTSIPSFIQPFLSNGLLVGILLAIVLENVVNWDKYK